MSQFHRRSIRLPGYDYTRPGAYFVTMVTRGRARLFGEIINDVMHHNEAGRIACATWEWIANHFEYISIDAWVVMPNHTHGIIFIKEMDDIGRGESRTKRTSIIKPLGQIVGAYKTVSAKQINRALATPGISVWQRDYYEHIIRDEAEFQSIVDYIQANPSKWDEDRFHKK